MKKLFLSGCVCLILAGCGAFHTKQDVNDTYYKKTQSIAWPEESLNKK